MHVRPRPLDTRGSSQPLGLADQLRFLLLAEHARRLEHSPSPCERAYVGLVRRVERVADTGVLGEKSVVEAARESNAKLEWTGELGAARCRVRSVATEEEEHFWREALLTVIRRFRSSGGALPRAEP